MLQWYVRVAGARLAAICPRPDKSFAGLQLGGPGSRRRRTPLLSAAARKPRGPAGPSNLLGMLHKQRAARLAGAAAARRRRVTPSSRSAPSSTARRLLKHARPRRAAAKWLDVSPGSIWNHANWTACIMQACRDFCKGP